jgi:MFS family permease
MEGSTRYPAGLIALVGLVALAIAMGIGRFAFTPILPMMQEDAGLSIAAGAWLAVANYVGYLIGALSAIGMRVRPPAAIRVGLLLIGVSTVAMGLDDRFVVWVFLRAVAGVASAWVLVYLSTWALDQLAALGRSNLSGAVYAGVGTGIVVAGAVCLLIMGIRAPSAAAWIALGIVSLVFTGVIWRYVKSSAVAFTVPASAAPQSQCSDAEFWRLVLCYGAFGFGYIIPATFLPVMAKDIVADPGLFGWAWPIFGAAAIASTLFAAHWGRTTSHRRVWIVGNVLMGVGVVVPLVVPGLVGIVGAALFVGGTFVVNTMAGMQEARRVAGSDARVLMAAMTSAFAVGQIAGPVCVSYMVGIGHGYAAALILASALLALSAFALTYQEGK